MPVFFYFLAGDDLDAVYKFLDTSGQKLDYRRYGVTLTEILVAGGLLGKLILPLLNIGMALFLWGAI